MKFEHSKALNVLTNTLKDTDEDDDPKKKLD